jgi:lipopolysaccharide export system permease protein
MGILGRYFSKEILKYLGIFLFALVFIYLTVDFTQKIDNFIQASVPTGPMLTYFAYKIPYVMIQMVPIAVVLSVIVTLCLMKKNHEITAMKACGLSVVQLSRPIILISVLIAVTAFLFSEFVVPLTSSRSNEIWNIEVNKRIQTSFYRRDHIWYKSKDAIYWIREFDPEKEVMEDMTFYFFDDSFRLIKRIDAQKGIWMGRLWKIHKGIIQNAVGSSGFDLSRFDEMHLKIREGPDAFFRTVSRPEEMSYWQLKRYAERIRMEGYDATRYLVDMNIKLAFPMINLVMILIGISIALGIKKGGIPLAVFLGVAACFLYLIVFGFARSLGLSGALPPVLSAWFANVAFFFFGSYLIMHVET